MYQDLKNFKVVLFGTGRNAKPALEDLNNYGIEVAYFVDNMGRGGIDNYPVYSPEILLNEDKSKLKIIITPDFPIYENIQTQLREMGLEECLQITHFLCCDAMLTILGYFDDTIGFCCASSSKFHGTRPAFPYLDSAEATIVNFLEKRKDIINGTIPAECKNCSLLRPRNMFGISQFKMINISCYPSVCQARCIFCGVYLNSENTPKEAKQSHYPKMILEMIQYLQKNNLIADDCLFLFAPAEITIMPHKDLLLDAIANYRASFATNAFRFEPRIADSMKKNNSFVNVSLDSGTKETFKLVKGYDLFEKVVNNLQKYREYNTFYLKYNILSGVNDSDADIEGIVKILKLLDLNSLALSFEYDMPLRTAFYPIVKFVSKLKENGLDFTLHSYYAPPQIEAFIKLYFNSESQDYYIEKNNHLREIFYSKYLNSYGAYKEYVYQYEIKELVKYLRNGTSIALLGFLKRNQRIASWFQKLDIPIQLPDLSLEDSYDFARNSADIFIVPEKRLFNDIKSYVESKGGSKNCLLDIGSYFFSFEPTKLFLKNNVENEYLKDF